MQRLPIAELAAAWRSLGVTISDTHDYPPVHGGGAVGGVVALDASRSHPVTINPCNDHRVAMAWALAGLLSPGIAIRDPDCVS